MLGPADDQRGYSSPAVVLSDPFWRRQYGADPAVVGRTLTLDGHAYEIVGVTPRNFFGVDVGRSFDVMVPLCAEPLSRGAQSGLGKRDVWLLAALARLKPGVSVSQAAAQLAAVSPSVFEATAPANFTPDDLKSYVAFTLTATPAPSGVSVLRASYETPLWVLLGVTGLVLVIACANLANLMLARATAREREIAVRLAIGASRARILRQMLSESFLVAMAGAAGGVLIAQWFSRFLVAFLSTEDSQLFVDLTLDWRTLAFTMTLSGFFGGLAALIATIGLYGVMSYMVARRKVEIGIRMALGADRGSVVRLMIREAGWLVGIGLAVGGVLAVFAGRGAATLLYGLEPWDRATLAAGMVGLAAVAGLASWIPARRASRLAPTIALRED